MPKDSEKHLITQNIDFYNTSLEFEKFRSEVSSLKRKIESMKDVHSLHKTKLPLLRKS